MGRGLFAVAHGWFANERLLEGQPESAEHGVLMLMRGINALFAEGDLPRAIAEFDRAAEIGLAATATRTRWRSSERAERSSSRAVEEGLALLDEATASAVCGELRPFSTGVVYCITISSCQDLGDYRRAAEWTEVANRWCDRLEVTGPGACRIHRAEIMRLRGEWPQAEEQAIAVRGALRLRPPHHRRRLLRDRRAPPPHFAGRGREGRRAGRAPQPGLALLRLAEARSTAQSRRSRARSRTPRTRFRGCGACRRRSRSRSRRAT